MLGFQKYCNMKIEDFKDFMTVVFVLVDDLYKEYIPDEIKYRLHKDTAILTDSEIITISIAGELFTINSEKAWHGFIAKNAKDLFPKICERSRFNRTKRNLIGVIEEIRKQLNQYITGYASNERIIDSFPLPVCKFGRARFCKTFQGYGADYGKCPSKKETYLGYKVHILCTREGYITDFIISPASKDDRSAIWELIEGYNRPLTIIGDKGYISRELAFDLKKEASIDLIYMQKDNAKKNYPKKLRQIIFKIRRRIETSISQLTEQLNIEIVKAKTFWGLKVRLHTKLLAFNLSFFINQLMAKENPTKIKELIF